MLKKIVLFSLTFFALSHCVLAQKAPTEGFVAYKMNLEGDEPQLAMMAGSTMKVIFKDAMTKVVTDMMNGMIGVDVIMDTKKKKGLMLFNAPIMGQKVAVEMNEADIAADKKEVPEMKIEYFKNETKKIVGYDCYKAVMSMEGQEIVAYVTDKIKINSSTVSKQLNGLQGFPMAYEMNAGGIMISFEASEVSTAKVDAAEFSLKVPEGFKKMTMKEFEEQMGGRMGF